MAPKVRWYIPLDGWDTWVWTKEVEQPTKNAILSHIAKIDKNRENYKGKIIMWVGMATNITGYLFLVGNQDSGYNSFAPVDPLASAGKLDSTHWPAVENVLATQVCNSNPGILECSYKND